MRWANKRVPERDAPKGRGTATTVQPNQMGSGQPPRPQVAKQPQQEGNEPDSRRQSQAGGCPKRDMHGLDREAVLGKPEATAMEWEEL